MIPTALTACQSKERVEAIKNASAAGKMFYAAHRKHLSLDAFLIKGRDKMQKENQNTRVNNASCLQAEETDG